MVGKAHPWKLAFAKQARNDAAKIVAIGLQKRCETLFKIVMENPLENTEQNPLIRLTGPLAGYYCRRINIHHRFIYTLHIAEHTVQVLSLWSQPSIELMNG